MSKIVWNGGENPAGSQKVTITQRNGEVLVGYADVFDWEHLKEDDPAYDWDIVEYELGDTIVE